MSFSLCPKCHMMIAEAAYAVHDALNHPKRQAPPGALATLAKARAVRRERIAARQQEAARLEAAWEGRTR